MKVEISGCSDSAECVWRDRTKQVVEVTFDDGFLEEGNLCWRCLQRAVRVRARRQENGNGQAKQKAAAST